MEIINHETRKDNFSIYFIGDIHYGAANVNFAALKSVVKYIEAQSKARPCIVITTGDLLDAVLPGDKRFSPAEIDPEFHIRDMKDFVRVQARELAKKFEPINHLIKYCVIGNHEIVAIKNHHFDVYDYLTRDLFQAKKLGFYGRLCVKTPEASIKIDVCHGAVTGGRRGIYGALINTFASSTADVRIMGHAHQLTEFDQNLLDNNGDEIKYRRILYGCAGTFLDCYKIGYAAYFEGRSEIINAPGCLELRVQGNKWKLKKIQAIQN